jgi:CRISPR-associated exonuclease Cas4
MNTLDIEDYLLISGIQHFVFCRRQWALIHIENQWAENMHTVAGHLMHTNAHNPSLTEKRRDLIITREMPIFSHKMGARGMCDVVEFHRDDQGVSLFRREGSWQPCPVEYKSGKPKTHDADKLQLCAQALCLEEMLLCPPILNGYLFYGETKHREAVPLTDDLRNTVCRMFTEMHDYFDRRHTPRVKSTKACTSCSMKDICLPKMPNQESVDTYIKNALAEDESGCESF